MKATHSHTHLIVYTVMASFPRAPSLPERSFVNASKGETAFVVGDQCYIFEEGIEVRHRCRNASRSRRYIQRTRLFQASSVN